MLAGALSCSDPFGPGIRSSVTFTYTGPVAGSFSASGGAPGFAAPGTSWVVGYVEEGALRMAGFSPRSGGLVGMAMLHVGRTTPGAESIDPECNPYDGAACSEMMLSLGFNQNGDSDDPFCYLTSGLVVLTQISGSRAKGTFSGTGHCSTWTDEPSPAFSVSNGAFDVALSAPRG